MNKDQLEVYLEENANELSDISDQLNKKYTEIEQRIEKIGVSAWSDKLIGVKDRPTGYRFGFSKVYKNSKDGGGKQWRFVCQKVKWNEGDEKNYEAYGNSIPIVEAQRSLRVEASSLVEEVLEKLKVQSAKFNEDIKSAVNNLNRVN